MRSVLFSLALWSIGLASLCGAAGAQHQHTGSAPSAAPKIDKAAVTKYLRYAEGFTPQVQVAIDDPKPSPFPGFYELRVRLTANKNEAIRTYYITQDGRQIVTGPVFDLSKSPFIANLQALKPDGAPSFGPENAAVQIYIFSDFECPYCREEAKVLRQDIEKEHANDVRVIFKNFPLSSIHPWARPAAVAGSCVAEQNGGAFWAYHDWIYAHQSEINPTNVRDKVLEFAKGQPIDSQKLTACMDSNATAPQVDKTIEEGRLLGIVQTPTLFVNGRTVAGALSADQMNLLIQIELQHHQQEKQQQASVQSSEKCCALTIPAVGKP
jgi:protein-disulfide isomerase